MSKPTPQEAVNTMSDFVNNFNVNETEFCNIMGTEHRTLQQSFTRFCLKWLEHCASPDYRFDDRNKASHEISATMIESFKKAKEIEQQGMGGFNPSEWLPFI